MVGTYISIPVTGALTEPTAARTLDLTVDAPGASRDAVLVPAAVGLWGRGHVVGDYANPARGEVINRGCAVGRWIDRARENDGCG